MVTYCGETHEGIRISDFGFRFPKIRIPNSEIPEWISWSKHGLLSSAHPDHCDVLAARRHGHPFPLQQTERKPHQVVDEPGGDRRFLDLTPALVLVRLQQRGSDAVRRGRAVDSDARRALPRRYRRHITSARASHDASWAARDSFIVVGDRRPVEGILRIHVDASDRHAGGLCFTRLLPVLRFLGGHAGTDVFPHWRMGRFEKTLCGDQVLPLYAGRLRSHAVGTSGPVLHLSVNRGTAPGYSRAVRARQHIQHSRVPSDWPVFAVQLPMVGLPGILCRFCDQGADVPVPHVAA